MKNAKSQDKRSRNWTFVLYPESAPSDWLQRLEDLHIQVLVSPIHDKDVNPDKTIKKAHYHIVLIFESNKSFSQIKEIADSFNAPIPQICQSVKGMARYLTHMDNPLKYQYDKADIITMGGVDLAELLKPSSQDRYTMIREMLAFIDTNSIKEFEDILYYAMNEKFDTWFPLLCDNSAYIISQAINSKRNRFKEENKVLQGGQLINYTTGEIEEIEYLKKGEADEN